MNKYSFQTHYNYAFITHIQEMFFAFFFINVTIKVRENGYKGSGIGDPVSSLNRKEDYPFFQKNSTHFNNFGENGLTRMMESYFL